jgi:hypothetical protein
MSKYQCRAGGVAQAVECLLSKCQTPISKKKKKKKEEGIQKNINYTQ